MEKDSMTTITGPEIQLLGSQGGFHQIKIQYIYTEDNGFQYRRGLVLLVSPENLPRLGLEWELPHKELKYHL